MARTPSSKAPPLSLAQAIDSTVKPAKAASSTPATTDSRGSDARGRSLHSTPPTTAHHTSTASTERA